MMHRRRSVRTAFLRGVMLLEVVLSIAILLIAILILGAAFQNSFHGAAQAERLTRAMLLTDDLLTQLDTGMFYQMNQSQMTEQTLTGALVVPGMAYELKVLPDDLEPELMRVTATIFEGSPESAEEERNIVLQTHTLRPKYRTLNLKNDFGMTEEQTKQLTDAIPGGEQVLDPENFDPTSLARLDMDTLAQYLPMIMAAMQSGQLSGDMGDLEGMMGGGQGGGGGANSGGSGGQDSGGRRGTRNPRSTTQIGGGS